MPSSRIQGKEHAISEILNGNFIFRIPNYQRPYAWQVDQAETLLQDIFDAIGDFDDANDDTESYFLGSIVIAKNEYEREAIVIDGQQRLTTLTLLLAVIQALTTDEKIKRSLSRFIYEEGDIIIGTSDRYHLTLRKKNEVFFKRKSRKIYLTMN
jgi:uncharacterized protein with ParB-like and HNH nuclease domain